MTHKPERQFCQFSFLSVASYYILQLFFIGQIWLCSVGKSCYGSQMRLIDSHKGCKIKEVRILKRIRIIAVLLYQSQTPPCLLECKGSVTRVVISTSCKTDQCIIYAWVLKLFLFISRIFIVSKVH